MKKLGKINISPEKVMINEELFSLRGGYGGSGSGWFRCTCQSGANPPFKSSWTKYYTFPEDMVSDIQNYCINGEGSCVAT